MEKKIIRVGSVGLGGIWSGVHQPGIDRSPDLELTAICDIDETKLNRPATAWALTPPTAFWTIAT